MSTLSYVALGDTLMPHIFGTQALKPSIIVGGNLPVSGNGQFLPIIILVAVLLAPIVFAGITNIVNALKNR